VGATDVLFEATIGVKQGDNMAPVLFLFYMQAAIEATTFSNPNCPVYQNVVASAVTSPEEIQANLIAQLTAPVRWTQSVQQMIADGASSFTEIGPGKVLQGLVKKIDREMITEGMS